jgi:hypothetical protein
MVHDPSCAEPTLVIDEKIAAVFNSSIEKMHATVQFKSEEPHWAKNTADSLAQEELRTVFRSLVEAKSCKDLLIKVFLTCVECLLTEWCCRFVSLVKQKSATS